MYGLQNRAFEINEINNDNKCTPQVGLCKANMEDTEPNVFVTVVQNPNWERGRGEKFPNEKRNCGVY